MTGEQSAEEKRAAFTHFRKSGGLLVLTAAATEAVPLEFVKQCLHYDLPWNPGALFRRFSRVHRFNSPPGPVHHYFFVDGVFSHEWMIEKLLRLQEAAGVDLLDAILRGRD